MQHEIRAGEQRRQDRLQHQRRAAGRTNGELVVARLDLGGFEAQALRGRVRSRYASAADVCRGLHGSEVLPQEPWLFSSCTDPVDSKRSPRHK